MKKIITLAKHTACDAGMPRRLNNNYMIFIKSKKYHQPLLYTTLTGHMSNVCNCPSRGEGGKCPDTVVTCRGIVHAIQLR